MQQPEHKVCEGHSALFIDPVPRRGLSMLTTTSLVLSRRSFRKASSSTMSICTRRTSLILVVGLVLATAVPALARTLVATRSLLEVAELGTTGAFTQPSLVTDSVCARILNVFFASTRRYSELGYPTSVSTCHYTDQCYLMKCEQRGLQLPSKLAH